jgi:hypothetical protein
MTENAIQTNGFYDVKHRPGARPKHLATAKREWRSALLLDHLGLCRVTGFYL